MGKSEIGVSITIDVSYRAALGVVAVCDFVRLPRRPEFSGILKPPDSIYHPAGGHHIRCSIVIHVDRPLTAIRNKFAKNTNLPVLMPNPLSSVRTRILVPIRSAHEIRTSVTIHIDGGDPFRMVRA